MIPIRPALVLLLAAVFSTAAPAFAQTPAISAATPSAEEAAPVSPDAPYDTQLARLAEILGSLHYLRTLCAPVANTDWRAEMQQLLDSETKDEPKRKERMTAAFNRGYRSFASVYTDCTPAAVVAEERYRNEGATLAAEITSRFGN